MAPRLIKQGVILLIFLVIAGGGGAAYYFLSRPAPTCFDGTQNQNEEGVDCGGVCVQPCVNIQKKAGEIEVPTTQMFFVKNDIWAVFAKMRNKSQDFGASRLSYEFQFFDPEDRLIGSQIGVAYLLPQEERYIIEPRVVLSQSPAKVSFVIHEIYWEKLRDYKGEPELFIDAPFYTKAAANEPHESEFTGILRNASDFDFDTIHVNVVLFDRDGEALGAGTIEIKTMRSGEQRFFKMVWPDPLRGEVETIDAKPETNVFFSENYIKRHGTSERFQEYVR